MYGCNQAQHGGGRLERLPNIGFAPSTRPKRSDQSYAYF